MARMIYCFDIDGTICDTDGMDYANAQPIPWMVEAIQKLHAAGHEIRYYTARGFSGSKQEQSSQRKAAMLQLRAWGLPTPGRVWTKPYADVYVDDRMKLPGAFRVQCVSSDHEQITMVQWAT